MAITKFEKRLQAMKIDGTINTGYEKNGGNKENSWESPLHWNDGEDEGEEADDKYDAEDTEYDVISDSEQDQWVRI